LQLAARAPSVAGSDDDNIVPMTMTNYLDEINTTAQHILRNCTPHLSPQPLFFMRQQVLLTLTSTGSRKRKKERIVPDNTSPVNTVNNDLSGISAIEKQIITCALGEAEDGGFEAAAVLKNLFNDLEVQRKAAKILT
jgi:hypothetical protein